jgi:undecaprenyl diphosphate synthase
MPEKPDQIANQNEKSPAGGADLSVDAEVLSNYGGVIPNHVAIIMDGNGRWAQQRGMVRIKGHHEGAHSVRRIVEACRYLNVGVLTLYAFSTQNWGRPQSEVSGLMKLFGIYIKKERERLLRNGIRLRVIGDREALSKGLRKSIESLEEASKDNTGMLLQVAVSYGGREEILAATRQIARAVRAGELEPDEITEASFGRYLYTGAAPDPDLVIRTSGEFRISNFLLWQIAYSEIYVSDVLWPDFDEARLIEAFSSFASRERRFGMTGEQVSE